MKRLVGSLTASWRNLATNLRHCTRSFIVSSWEMHFPRHIRPRLDDKVITFRSGYLACVIEARELIKISACSDARDRNNPISANQIRPQTSLINHEHRPIRLHSRCNGACVRPFEQRKKTLQHDRWSRGTARNVQIDRNDAGDTSNDRVATGETAAIPRAISDRDDPLGIGDRIIGALQCVAHVLGHGPRHHQYVGMAWRGNEPQAEAFDIVVGVVKCVAFELASIAGAGVDLAYGETSAEPPPRRAADGCCEFAHRGIVRRWRLLGERPAKQTLEKQLAHFVLSLDHGPIRLDRIMISSFCLSMISSENRFPLFRIMLY